MTIDGPLKSVYVVNDDDLKVNGGRWLLMGGGAIKVRGYTSDTIASRRVIGGDALPVYVLGENDIKQRGGNFRLKGGQPIRVTDVIGAVRGVKQGAAVAVYPVLDDGVTYDTTFSGICADLPTIAGQVFWFEGDAITGLSNGDPVPQWDDLSGNGNHATQGVVANRPDYITGVINGLPILRFNGTSDAFSVVLNIAASDYTLVVAHEHDGGPAQYFLDSQTGRFIIAQRQSAVPNTNVGWYDGAWRPGGLHATNWEILSFVLDNAGATTWRNGAALGGNAYNSIAIGAQTRLFSRFDETGNWYAGDVYAMLLYQGALSAADRESVEEYLACKTGITLS